MSVGLGAAAAIAGAASGVAQGGMGLIQQGWNQNFQSAEAEKARDFNASQAAINRDFNASQAALGREFSERMSSTSYQRAINDMKAAGVNPNLLMSQGGASTPQSSMASGSAASGSGVGSGSTYNALGGLGSILHSAVELSLADKNDGFEKNIQKAARSFLAHNKSTSR